MGEEHSYASFPSSIFSNQITFQHVGASSSSIQDPNFFQYFLHVMPLCKRYKRLVFYGRPEDKVHSIHKKIQSLFGIPVAELRLMFDSRFLKQEETLSECLITNNSELYLQVQMGNYVEAWTNELASEIFRLSKNGARVFSILVEKKLMDLIKMITKDDVGFPALYVHYFTSSGAPEYLVMLYMFPDSDIKSFAETSVKHVINIIFTLPQSISLQLAPIVLEFCKLLRKAALIHDPLYKFCRGSLVTIMTQENNFDGGSYYGNMFPYHDEEVNNISMELVLCMGPKNNFGPSSITVEEFVTFLRPLKAEVEHQVFLNSSSITFGDPTNRIRFLYEVFHDLLIKLLICLDTMQEMVLEDIEYGGWKEFLKLLKVFHDVSKLYGGTEEYFWTNLRHNNLSLCYLIVRYAKKGEDYEWLIKRKELLNFFSRRHLVMLMLPNVHDHAVHVHKMLIDRSNLLVESFESIALSQRNILRAGLYIVFKDEEATGFGVMREWFFLVCQEIFNPKNDLFIACPNDGRRFFLNPASKMNPVNLQYYAFAGRVIALALMRKIHVGFTFDRSFFLQLAGNKVSLEDIKDADQQLYSSCHIILEMNPSEVDKNVLGLSFVYEEEEHGFLKTKELCHGGAKMVVDSLNRKEYIDLLVQYRFMTSTSEQLSHFAQGFTDIVGEERTMKMCFRALEHEDLDMMLCGSVCDISLEDWKAHTDYQGYEETDPQICWFWEIVRGITSKQRRDLLFFWTSMKYLPVEGFCGLNSKLSIIKSHKSIHHLPSSHTCFYQLCLPAYPSLSEMQRSLNFIVQDHVCYSFGES